MCCGMESASLNSPLDRAALDRAGLAGALVPVAGQERYVRQRFWTKLRRVLGRIPFAEQVIAAYFAATDPATPTHVKAVLFAALAYFIVPTDLIPDVIALAGFTDDLAVLTIALKTFAPHVTAEHRDRARRWRDAHVAAPASPGAAWR